MPDLHPKKSPHRSALLAALFFAAWAAWLSCLYVASGSRSYLRIHDCGDSSIPMVVAKSHDTGGSAIGARNATLVCGFYQDAAWAGLVQDRLFTLFPTWLAYGLVMWLQRFAAGLGFALLARFVVGFRWAPSIVAAMAYGMFSQTSINGSWGGYTYYDGLILPGLPWLIWGLHACVAGHRSTRWWPSITGAAAIGITYAATGGYVFSVFTLTLAFCWLTIMFRPPGANLQRVITVYGTAWISWVLCSWHNISAGLAVASDSQRIRLLQSAAGGGDFYPVLKQVGNIALENWGFLTIASMAVFFRPGKRWCMLFYALLACASITVAARPMAHFLAPIIGFLQGFQWQRAYLLLPFLAMMAGAAGLDHFLASSRSGRPVLRWCVHALTLALLAWIVQTSVNVHRLTLKLNVEGWSSVIFEHPDLQRLARTKSATEPFRVVTVAAAGAGQWHPDMMAAYGLECADGYVTLYPRRYSDFWQLVIQPRLVGDPALAGQVKSWGNRAYVFGPPTLAEGSTPLAEIADLRLLSTANVRYIISPTGLQDPSLTEITSASADPAKNIKRNPKARWAALRAGLSPLTSLYIYENNQVRPRFCFAQNVAVKQSADDVLAAMSARPSSLSSGTVFLAATDLDTADEHFLHGRQDSQNQTGSVTLLECSADEILLETSNPSPALLFIANSYDPGWTARVDDVITPIVPANHAFQGIFVAAGEHRVQLDYSAR